MKILKAVMLSAALAAPAQAAPQGWYLGAGAGWSWMSGKANFASIPDTNINYDSHARFSGALGYKWGAWRAELEPDWVTNDAGLTGYNGGTTTAALMANIVYDWQLDKRWTLFGGIGVGGARVSHNIWQVSTGKAFLAGHDVAFAAQLIAGASYALTYNVELAGEYRYMHTGDANAQSQFSQPVKYENGQNHIAMATIRWYPFVEEEHAPPPPAPAPLPPRPIAPPPPPPVPMPAPARTYVVFFDFNKSDVNAGARAIVAQAVDAVKRTSMVRILISGHTDTVGSAVFNLKLSERRAAAVKDAMVGMGVSAQSITTTGKGYSEPLVPTGPNVREPQNRRAVIDLGN